jgi:hypothetical protein
MSHLMRHNATKSEALVLHCSSSSAPPITLPSSVIPVRAHVTVLGMIPDPSGFCDRPGAYTSGAHAAQLFVKAWRKLRLYVTLQELRSLLMAFVYSHSVFGSCLQRFTSHRLVSPMTRCIRAAILAHPSVNSISLYEFMGLMLPSLRAVYLRSRYLLRCLDPSSPQFIRDEFRAHRKKSPWFAACLRSLSSLPQPKSGPSLIDRLETCLDVLASPDAELPDTFLTPPQTTSMQFLSQMDLLPSTSIRVLALLAGAIFCSTTAGRIVLAALSAHPLRITLKPWPFFMEFVTVTV